MRTVASQTTNAWALPPLLFCVRDSHRGERRYAAGYAVQRQGDRRRARLGETAGKAGLASRS